MKNKILKIFFTIALFITSFIGVINVNAYNSSLSASKSTVNPGDTFTISLNVSGLDNKLGSANYSLKFDNTLFEYEKSSIQSNLVNNVVKLAYVDSNGGATALDNGTFATITFKVKSSITSDKTGSFSLTSTGTLDKDANSITSTNSGTSVKIHVPSDDNTLSDLKVDGVTITGFSKDKTSYEINSTSDSITIGATKNDSNATITGKTGKQTLSYGTNTFEIVVTSEKGTKKTYKITVTRPDNRSDDSTLKTLTVSGIAFSFKSNKTTYDLSSDNETVSITATTNNSKATVTGAGSKKLSYGNNSYKIVVTSEKGNKTTYTLNIKRNDVRSANNNLATLSLSTGSINFKPSTTTYNVTVDSNTSKVTINATLEDSKSSFVTNYGPRTINLSNGNNKVLIKVKNEREEVKTYTLNINKDDGRDTNADLEYLKITEGSIDFNKDTTEYKITVENDVNKLTIDTKAISSKAKISLTNPTLVEGENKVKILVTAENGATKEYVITVVKKEKDAVLSNDNYLSSIEIQNYSINFDRDTLVYTLKINNEESLIINPYKSNENAFVSILGNESLKDGSIITIKVTAENGETRDYQINIQKGDAKTSSTSSIPTNYIVVGLLGVVLIVLIVIIVIKKNKDKGDNNFINNQNNNINPTLNNNLNTNNVTNNNVTPSNVVTDQNAVSEPVITNPVNNVNPANEQVTAAKPTEEKKEVINNPSGLTKVCSSCGRRVPYEAGTCPYCMTDF